MILPDDAITGMNFPELKKYANELAKEMEAGRRAMRDAWTAANDSLRLMGEHMRTLAKIIKEMAKLEHVEDAPQQE